MCSFYFVDPEFKFPGHCTFPPLPIGVIQGIYHGWLGLYLVPSSHTSRSLLTHLSSIITSYLTIHLEKLKHNINNLFADSQTRIGIF